VGWRKYGKKTGWEALGAGFTEWVTEYLEEPAEYIFEHMTKSGWEPNASGAQFLQAMYDGLEVAIPSFILGFVGGGAASGNAGQKIIDDLPENAKQEDVAESTKKLLTGKLQRELDAEAGLKPGRAVTPEQEEKRQRAMRALRVVAKASPDAKIVEPKTAEGREAVELAERLGLDLVYSDDTGGAGGMTHLEDNIPTGVIIVGSRYEGTAMWQIVGHEITHGTRIDVKDYREGTWMATCLSELNPCPRIIASVYSQIPN